MYLKSLCPLCCIGQSCVLSKWVQLHILEIRPHANILLGYQEYELYLSQDDVFHFRYETSNDIKQQKKTPRTYLSGRTINLNQQVIFKRTFDLRIQVHPRENFKNLKFTQVCVIQIFCSKRRRTIWQLMWVFTHTSTKEWIQTNSLHLHQRYH